MSQPVEVMKCTYPDDLKFYKAGFSNWLGSGNVSSSGSSAGEARQRKHVNFQIVGLLWGYPTLLKKNPSLIIETRIDLAAIIK